MAAVPKTAKLIQKRILNLDTALLTFEVVDPLDFIGGQYIILNTGVKDSMGADIKRAYSLLSSDLDQTRFEICVRVVPGGIASSHLYHLDRGAELAFSGPWGKFIKNPLWPRMGHTLILATDTGITNALGLMTSQKMKPRLSECTILWLVKDSDYFLPFELVNSRVPDDFLDFHIVSVSPVGDSNRVPEVLQVVEEKLKSIPLPTNVFLAGDGVILRELKTQLEEKGVDPNWLNTEPFFNKQKEEKPAPGTPSSPSAAQKTEAEGFVRSGTTGKLVAIKDLREGFTTGACSAAAAKAATRALITRQQVKEVETTLPNRTKVTFQLHRCDLYDDQAICSVIKDAGDDPDATHGAEITAQVRWRDEAGIVVRGGAGVATVTKAGLGLEVGGPAINPVPS
jgi:ferredoxin-NADP reductase